VSALDLQIPGVTDQKIKKSPSEEEDENISDLSSDADEERSSSDDDSLPALRPRKPGKPYRSNMAELEKYPPLLISTLFSYIAIVILKVPVTLNEIFGYRFPGIKWVGLIIVGLKRTRFLIITLTKWFHCKCLDGCMDTPVTA